MMWLLAGLYCGALWLVFDKLRLLRLSLPVAIAAASIGPSLIIALLFCAQYCHPFTPDVHVFQKMHSITPQLKQAGHVTRIAVRPNKPIEAGAVLFEVDPEPYEHTVAMSKAALAEAEQNVAYSEAAVKTAEATIKRAAADLEFMTRERRRDEKLVEDNTVTREEFEATLASYQQASSASEQAEAGLSQARVSVDTARAKVASARASLESAEYDLEQTVVHAPSDGYVTNLQLQAGDLVGGAGSGSVMSFVPDRTEDDIGVVVALIAQKNYLLVRPGQYAEVALTSYPGEILKGRVQTTIDVTGAGQLDVNGDLPDTLDKTPTLFVVRIRLDRGDGLRLPAGARGCAAIYTDRVPIAGIPVMVGVRMMSWLSYVW